MAGTPLCGGPTFTHNSGRRRPFPFQMHSDYALLINKLDAFIRRFYKDQLIRGVLYSVGLLVAFFLLVSLGEAFGRFGSGARTVLFWAYLTATAVVLGRLIVLPLVKLFRLGPVISHTAAAHIIGTHFTEVKDKLLNTLQLRDQAEQDPTRRELIEASIAQRSRELKPVPFSNAIDLRRNTRYLRFALPPLAVLVVLLFAAPSLITGPAERLLAHGEEFAPEAPFLFLILNDTLQVPEDQDFELLVELEGKAVPQQAEVVVDGQRIPLVKQDAVRFTHRFRNVQEPITFHLEAEGFSSKVLTLVTVPDPLVLDLAMKLEYPAYLGLQNEVRGNTGDAQVPAGTRITWTANTRSADLLELAFDDTTYVLRPTGGSPTSGGGRGEVFTASRRLLQSRTYSMVPTNGDRKAASPLQYRIEVVPDLYPTIAVEQKADSTAPKRLYFRGDLGDDHGFKRLLFNYRFTEGGDSTAEDLRSQTIELGIDPKNTRQEFFHFWDVNTLTIGPGDKLEYWFEVWDNDGVNGSKSARSSTQVFEAPSLDELAEKQDQQGAEIKKDLQQGIKEAQDLQRELDKLRREMMDKKELSWQDQQKLQSVLDRQKQLQQRIENTTQKLEQQRTEQQQYRQMDERLLEKQKQVQDLFENVLNEEMKDLYKQVQEMLEKLDKEKLQEQMKDMKMDQEDIEKELDRALEQFKQMEVEQKAEDITKQLEKLAEEQKKLSEETKAGDTPKEELQQKQEELNKAFEDVRKELDELEKKNEELETPMELPRTEQQEQDIQQEQQKSSDELQKNQKQKAGDSQKKAGEQMEQMAFQMKSAMEQSEQEQAEEDMDAMRQLLENIVHLSIEQEATMVDVQRTSTRDPHIVDLGRTQKKLRDDARVIEDSLFALSKRVPQLQSIVNREMNAVNDNMDEAMERINNSRANEREKPMATDMQQRAMTSLNNLALLLDEALQQMQQQQQSSGKPGSGSCNKPGGSGAGKGNKASMAKMKAQQQALQKQLEEMKKGMEKGGKQQGPKPGEKNPGGIGPGMSQQLAQMAAQQAAIRKEMQRMAQELNKDGSGSGNGLNKLAEEMERTEKDIVNKRIDQETIRRQQDIMVRMLEAEKAERERELDQKRQSSEGRDAPHTDPARFFDYQRTKQRESEMLRTVPPGLKPYYKDRVNEYFDTFDRP